MEPHEQLIADVTEKPDGTFDVRIQASPATMFVVAEYLLHAASQASQMPYEDAMDSLVKGAMTWRSRRGDR